MLLLYKPLLYVKGLTNLMHTLMLSVLVIQQDIVSLRNIMSRMQCNVLAGTVQHVHATRAVKKGQQLCVHYTELFEPRRVRQQALLQEKFFSCACDRCSVPIEQSPDRFLEVRDIADRDVHALVG